MEYPAFSRIFFIRLPNSPEKTYLNENGDLFSVALEATAPPNIGQSLGDLDALHFHYFSPPVKDAFRFSMKAVVPSLASSLAIQGAKASHSRSRPVIKSTL